MNSQKPLGDVVSVNALHFERIFNSIERISDGQDELKLSMQKMADAVSRLALVEERQANASTSLERMGAAINKMDKRLRALEISDPLQNKAVLLVDKIIWAAVGLSMALITDKLGIL